MATSTSIPHINLLHGRSEQLKRERTLYAKVQFIVVIIIVMYCGLLMAIVAIRAYVSGEQRKITTEVSTEELALAQLKPVEEKYVLLQNKIKLLTDYLKSRGQAREFLLKIYQTLPVNVQLTSVSVNENEDSLAVTASALNMQAINDYLNSVNMAVNQGEYRQIALTGISRDPKGIYSISAEYDLPK
jgi:Tfp pilus assembly protein PilN